ncbi:hypothetical protein [Actinopolymorpha alba]|uniref:hypothetical protein n=1 Tax=Actinopolymorpha alba TaxID=533267 RepID=UPI00037B69F7|nr:hypothetical protein [Actinopolymorpha alba]
MTLIEWTRLAGGPVEAVVAMFINREHPNSHRITPSKGDGGVDILDPRGGPDGTDVVYQVKRYTDDRLSARQKAEIEDSLSRLMEDPRWARLDVREWHLVTPMNPSPEAENWLYDVATGKGVTAIWRGLEYVEQLAAKYGDVVDYYLNGNRGRIKEAYERLAAYFGADRTEGGLDALEVVKRVDKALLTLDDDPHYRYEHRFGEGTPPAYSSRQGLVMSMLAGNRSTGRWSVVDIIARCAASTEERPIAVHGHLKLERGSTAEKEFLDSLTYGAPFRSPERAYTATFDAPGGLGGKLEEATLSTWPHSADLGEDPELRLEVLDPAGLVLATVNVDRVERSQGTGGVRAVLAETNGVFTIEDRHNLVENSGRRTIAFGDFTGKPVGAVKTGLHFLGQCQAPNVLRVSSRHVPAEMGITDPNIGFVWDGAVGEALASTAHLIEILCSLQAHTATVIRTPDLGAVTSAQRRGWADAARVLSGEELATSYPEGHGLLVEFEAGVPLPEGTFSLSAPLVVEVGPQRVDLGRVEIILRDPNYGGPHEFSGTTYHLFQTRDRSIAYRRSKPLEP